MGSDDDNRSRYCCNITGDAPKGVFHKGPRCHNCFHEVYAKLCLGLGLTRACIDESDWLLPREKYDP